MTTGIVKTTKLALVLAVSLLLVITMLGVSAQSFGADRLELDETSIVGSKELPKVLYIVPWKNSQVGTIVGTSAGGSVQQGVVALDREVFQREIKYFGMLQGSGNLSQ